MSYPNTEKDREANKDGTLGVELRRWLAVNNENFPIIDANNLFQIDDSIFIWMLLARPSVDGGM